MGDSTALHIKDLLADWDNLSKDEIKEKLEQILPKPCPGCHGLYAPIGKFGRELDPNAKYTAAETYYFVCPACKYIHSYCY